MSPEAREALAGILKAAGVALAVSWVLLPLALSMLYAFADPGEYYSEGKVVPTRFTLEQLRRFMALGAGEATVNSVVVALATVALSFAIGLPAGYAIARYAFPGRDAVKLLLVGMRMFPVIAIGVPLAVLYLRIGLNDTLLGVALAHTSMALPFVVLITSSIFAGIPREVEEAGLVFGLTRAGVVLHITMPIALPGLTAAAMFAFLLSWNEVFVASVLTLTNRTLPAFVLAQVAAATDLIKMAAVAVMLVPAFIFVFAARRYLVTMWGITLK
ncbi:carbohydrate ABC transporter permease [Stetteria hydrogenophila]